MRTLFYIPTLAFCFLHIALPVAAQQKQGQALLDSLLVELPKTKGDTARVDLLWDISNIYERINPAEGVRYAEQGLELAQKIGWKQGMLRLLSQMGIHYAYQSNYPKALEHQHTALKLAEDLGKKNLIALCLGNIGNTYFQQHDFPKALECYLKVSTLFEELGHKPGIASTYSNIAGIYYFQKDYTKALEYCEKALKINEEIGNKSRIATNINNIADIYKVLKNYPKALEYGMKALGMNKEIGDKVGMAHNNSNIAMLYLTMAKDKAASSTDRQQWLQQAVQKLDTAAGLFEELGDINRYKDALQYLAEAHSLAGEYEKAFEAHKQYVVYKDSVYNEENTKKIARLEAEYTYSKKEDSLKLENQRKELAMQKEMQLAALRFEYEKKQAAAQSEQEKQRLLYEEELKRQQINREYEQKEAEARIKQEQKETEAAYRLQRQKTYTYAGAGLALVLLASSLLIIRNNKRLAAEKEKSEHLLHNILPEEVADELKNRGAATVREFDAVSVLFTDFVNFTRAGERMSSRELIDELHECFRAFDAIIEKYGIEKMKTIGDAYMAVCGLPNSDERHAQKVTAAALEIRDFMQERRSRLGNKTFEIRIGIHSGSVVAGIVGIKKFAYDIWGDTVNTASRIESSGEPGKINISETTYRLVKNDFECEYRGEVEAKGKGWLKMYFVNR